MKPHLTQAHEKTIPYHPCRVGQPVFDKAMAHAPQSASDLGQQHLA
jgi:hypothetical protein